MIKIYRTSLVEKTTKLLKMKLTELKLGLRKSLCCDN